jgi:hypothetical protein
MHCGYAFRLLYLLEKAGFAELNPAYSAREAMESEGKSGRLVACW